MPTSTPASSSSTLATAFMTPLPPYTDESPSRSSRASKAPGAGARGHRRAADGAGDESDLDLDGGLPPRVEDLPGVDGRDLAHGRSGSGCADGRSSLSPAVRGRPHARGPGVRSQCQMPLPPFSAFLEREREVVYRVLVGLVGPDDADDCFQETFIKALRAYPRPAGRAATCAAWVLTIARRTAIDAARARGAAAGAGWPIPTRSRRRRRPSRPIRRCGRRCARCRRASARP